MMQTRLASVTITVTLVPDRQLDGPRPIRRYHASTTKCLVLVQSHSEQTSFWTVDQRVDLMRAVISCTVLSVNISC